MIHWTYLGVHVQHHGLLDLQAFVTRAAHTPAPSLDNGALRERTTTDDAAAAAAGSSSSGGPVSDGAPSSAAAAAQPPASSSLIGDLLDLDISDPSPAAAAALPPPVEGLYFVFFPHGPVVWEAFMAFLGGVS